MGGDVLALDPREPRMRLRMPWGMLQRRWGRRTGFPQHSPARAVSEWLAPRLPVNRHAVRVPPPRMAPALDQRAAGSYRSRSRMRLRARPPASATLLASAPLTSVCRSESVSLMAAQRVVTLRVAATADGAARSDFGLADGDAAEGNGDAPRLRRSGGEADVFCAGVICGGCSVSVSNALKTFEQRPQRT